MSYGLLACKVRPDMLRKKWKLFIKISHGLLIQWNNK